MKDAHDYKHQKRCLHCGEVGYHLFHFPPETKIDAIVVIVSAIVGGTILGCIF